MSGAEFAPGVTRAALAALLERHNLGAPEQIEPLAGGTVATLLRVNGAFVVRLNTRDPHLPSLAWEALIYRRLARETDVPVPQVLALDTQRDLLPHDALVLSYVEGVNGATVWPSLDAATQEQLSEELGRICGTVHRLPWPRYREAAGSASYGRWTDVITHKAIAAYEGAARLGVLPPRVLDAWLTTLNEGDALYAEASPPTLVHSDLWLGNVVLRQDGAAWRVAGVIDWEGALLADAAWEFASLWRDHDPWPLPDAFMDGYRERRPLPADLRMRRRLYRLLDCCERAVSTAQQDGASSAATQFYVAALQRLLAARI